MELMKEVEYFGDIVIVPYMDNYDLVVLKTVAICEYGVKFHNKTSTWLFTFSSWKMLDVSVHGSLQMRTVPARYIMKCDDDTFVRVDAVLKEARKVGRHKSLYIGNINYHHKPLRHGKWAVTYEVGSLLLFSNHSKAQDIQIENDMQLYCLMWFTFAFLILKDKLYY